MCGFKGLDATDRLLCLEFWGSQDFRSHVLS